MWAPGRRAVVGRAGDAPAPHARVLPGRSAEPLRPPDRRRRRHDRHERRQGRRLHRQREAAGGHDDCPAARAASATGLKPLVVTQPDGPSFRIDGHDVVWQNWHFRVDYSPREGLVLNRIGYEQGGVVRPIIYRLALSEIYVPYGTPDANWYWRSAFDVGEYNLGQFAVEQEKQRRRARERGLLRRGSRRRHRERRRLLRPAAHGGDVRARRRLALAADRPDELRPRRAVRARAGRQGGVLHRQLHVRGGVRLPPRRRIDVHVNATGTTLNQGVETTAAGNRYGKTVAPNIAAPNHQHFLSFRIDFDVDGADNRVARGEPSFRRRARPATRSSRRRRRSRRSSRDATRRRIGTG